MSEQNIIQLGFNVEELSAQKKQVLDLFVDMFGKLKQYDGTRFNPLGGGGLADLKKSITDGTAAMDGFSKSVTKYNDTVTAIAAASSKAKKYTDDLSASEKEHQKNLQAIASLQARISEADTNAANDKAIEAQKLKAVTQEVNANAKAYLSQIGSVNEAKATIAQLTLERNKENATTEEGKARIAEINAEIDRQNQFIKENVSGLEQQKINIGNYTGALTGLETALNNINARLAQMTESGDTTSEAFQRLVLEQKLTEQTIDRQKEGFATVTAELRSMKNALDTLDLAGLSNTEVFKNLNTTYETSKQKLTELHNAQKIMTDESPALAGLAATARGLGGAYALGAGASALFASGNEKLDRELNKLVATMTFLQGLEEAVKALKERGAIATALQSAATNALNGIRRIETALFGEETAATTAATEAKIANAEANTVNAEALETNAASAEINTAAMDATTVATEGAEVATISFRTALISTGIGAIIVGVIYGVTKLVGAISDWISADERADKTQKDLAASTAELLETTKQLNDAYRVFAKEHIEGLQKVADLNKSAGKNIFVQLSDEKKVNDARLADSKRFVEQKKIDQKTVDDLYSQQVNALEVVASYEELIRQAEKAYGEDDSHANKARLEGLKARLELEKGDAKNVATRYTTARDALKEYTDAQQKANDINIRTAKAASDELDKLIADSAQRHYDVEKDAAQRILSLDTSTEKQRLAAVQSDYQAEQQLASSKIQAVQKQVKDQVITEADGADQIATIRNDLSIKYKKSLDDELKIRIEYADRLRDAQTSVKNNNLDSDAAVQDGITKDLQRELGDRLTAIRKSVADKTEIIENDYKNEIGKAKEKNTLDEEYQAIEGNRQKALADLTASTQKDIYDITISWGEKRIKAIEDLNKTDDSGGSVTGKYARDAQALVDGLSKNIFSYESYLVKKKELDDKYDIDLANAHVRDDQAELDRLLDFKNKELNIQILFAEKALQNAKAGGDDDEIKKAQAKLDALKAGQVKIDADIASATKKLNDDELIAEEKKNAKILAAEAKLQDNIRQLRQSSFDLAKQLVDASFENQINKIQQTIDMQHQQYDNEISAIGRSTLTQQQQAEESIILTNQKKAADTEARLEIKNEKIKEAKFDRDVAIAEIFWNTAKAVMKDTAGVPFPLSLAVAASDIAVGAIQAALVLAKPIPTYGEGIGIPGKGQHAGGLAWVGERYKPEQVTIPGHEPFTVSTPTLLNMPAYSQVLPIDPDNLVFDIGGVALAQGAARINNYVSHSTEVVDALDVLGSRMEKAFRRSQRKIINKITVNVDPNWESYLNKKVRGRG